MALDVTTQNSPGWHMQQMYTLLKAEQPRLNRLDAYRRGEPPIVMGRSRRMATAFARFQNMSRSNFAELIVSAMTNRMSARSIRTAAAGDDNGDQQAWRVWTANGLDVWQTDLYRSMGTFGVGYVAVGDAAEADGEPVITIEDPRQTVTVQDPLRPWRSTAAFKLYHDPQARMDYAVLWLPGEKWVAQRSRKARDTSSPVQFAAASFDLVPVGAAGTSGTVWADDQPDGVDWETFGDDYDGITSERYDLQDVPVVRFGNRDGVGEFELHTDLLDAIAHVTLQQMVIATLQAFRQRALKAQPDAEPLPQEDENGQPIDWNEVFEADPGALWELPAGWDLWESGQVEMNGILQQAKDYILRLAATTQTPFPMFSPDGANQSANGASLYREGLTFKVEDRCRIAGAGWAQVFAIAFKLKDDAQRGQAADILIDWAPADRYSILEMAQADAQSSLPLPQKAARIYGMSPAEVQIVVAQAAQQAFMDAAMKAQQQPPTPPRPSPVDDGSGATAA